MRNKKSTESNENIPNNEEEEEEPSDYVFRIIATFEKPDTICKIELSIRYFYCFVLSFVALYFCSRNH